MVFKENDSEHFNSSLVSEALNEVLGFGRVQHRIKLGPLTTFRVGGEAEWLITPRNVEEILQILRISNQLGLPITFLGGGSNVLVGELGVKGLVIRMKHGKTTLVRQGVVRSDAGVTLNGLVRWTINRDLGGLEHWAGTPGTVGGGVYGNAHFQGRLLSEQVIRVGLVDSHGDTCIVTSDEMEFDYDRSRVCRTGEAVVWAEFRVVESEARELRVRARESLAYRKKTQPLSMPSAGCIFKNLDPEKDNIPSGLSSSVGELIDKANLKGLAVGCATVSLVHGNFIVSDGHATPSDIRKLVALCREEVLKRFGVMLREEIVCLGEFES